MCDAPGGCRYDEPCNIIVTEPRRLSATSVAERVSAELGDGGQHDSWCGYQVPRGETRPGLPGACGLYASGVLGAYEWCIRSSA